MKKQSVWLGLMVMVSALLTGCGSRDAGVGDGDDQFDFEIPDEASSCESGLITPPEGWRSLHPPKCRCCDLAGCEWGGGINMTGADLCEANMEKAYLKNVTLANAKMIGVNMSRAWLLLVNLTDANLNFANLSHARVEAYPIGAQMIGVNFSGAYLNIMNATNANMYAADFTGASLFGTILTGANLQYANFAGAKMTSANLRGANLYGATFTSDTILDYSDFSGATWIDGRICALDNSGPKTFPPYKTGKCLYEPIP